MLADLGLAMEPAPPPESLAPTYAASADGSRIAVAGAKLTIHDSRTGAVLKQVDACGGQRVHSLLFVTTAGPRWWLQPRGV